MNTPSEGTLLTAADGTVFVIESVTDMTTDEEFEPGDSRFFLSLVEAAHAGDMGEIGYELSESEFADFCTEQGITLPA